MTSSTSVLALTLLATSCTVPDLTIYEQTSSATEVDADEPEDAGLDAEVSASSKRDAGAKTSVRKSKPAASAAAGGGNGGSGGNGEKMAEAAGAPAAGSGGATATARAGAAGAISAAGSGGSAGAPGSTAPACAVWTKVNVRDNNPPAGAVEGGFETVAGVTSRQYVCRFRPAGSSVTLPGKYVVGRGCYVAVRRDAQQVDDASMLDGMIDVLTPAAGCSFSWRAATGADLPPGVIDLGDPAGGRNYACHGDYSTVAASGKQIGTLITSATSPPQYQCFFESFSNAIQPMDPQRFEVLVQD